MAYFYYANTVLAANQLEWGESLGSLNKKGVRCMKKDFAVRGSKIISRYVHTL